jgi:glycosyltransferase involved in cell wall biosynthesis
LASLVRVYSVPMLIRAKKINRNVEKVVAPIDWRLIMPPLRDASKDIVRIVYATSRSEDKLSEIFKPALRRVLEKHPKGVQAHFLGYNPEEFRSYQNVFHHPMVMDYQNYLRSFSSAGYDIGLAPLLNDVFHRSKTNNKFREYGASQIAGIYSNVDVYSTCVEHKRTGILVENDPDAWFDAMEILIEDSAMRQNIQRQALEFVRNNYSQEIFVNLWHQQIIGALSRKDIKRRSTEKVENLIKENSHSMIWNVLTVVFNVAVNVFNVAVNVMRGIRIRIINYLSMYRMLLKLRLELWLINHSSAKKM